MLSGEGDFGDGKDGLWKEIGDGMVHSAFKGEWREKETVLVYDGFQYSFERSRENVEFYVCSVGGEESSCYYCSAEIKLQNGKYYWFVQGEHHCGGGSQVLDDHGLTWANGNTDSGHTKKSVTQTLDQEFTGKDGEEKNLPYVRVGDRNTSMNERNFHEEKSTEDLQSNGSNSVGSNNETGQLPQESATYSPYTNYLPNQGDNNPFNVSDKDYTCYTSYIYTNPYGFSSVSSSGQPPPTLHREHKPPPTPPIQHEHRSQPTGQSQRNNPQQSLPNHETNNLFIFHLPQSWNTRMLFRAFEPFGMIDSVRVGTDSDGISKGYGFVRFVNPKVAAYAASSMNGVRVENKFLKVTFAKKKKKKRKKGRKK